MTERVTACYLYVNDWSSDARSRRRREKDVGPFDLALELLGGLCAGTTGGTP